MVKLDLYREPTLKNVTFGKLFLDGIYNCETLEDAVRSTKIYGETAIPAGRYEVIISWSNRFKQRMPLLLAVPGFEGIRIHAGNTIQNTLGCILVAQRRKGLTLVNSRPAYKLLFATLDKRLMREKCFIEIHPASEALESLKPAA